MFFSTILLQSQCNSLTFYFKKINTRYFFKFVVLQSQWKNEKSRRPTSLDKSEEISSDSMIQISSESERSLEAREADWQALIEKSRWRATSNDRFDESAGSSRNLIITLGVRGDKIAEEGPFCRARLIPNSCSAVCIDFRFSASFDAVLCRFFDLRFSSTRFLFWRKRSKI